MEHTIYQGRTSLIKYWFLVGVGSMMVAAGSQLVNSPGAEKTGYIFSLPGLLLVGFAYLLTTATSYTVTSQRVIQRKGLFSPQTTEVQLSDIRSVKVDQNSTERLFGIGNVGVARAGRPGTEIVFTGIRKPKEVADMIPRRRKKPTQRGPGTRLTAV